jgi:hypothetical protein
MSNNSFYDLAARLGHDVDALRAGQTVSKRISVQNVEQLRDLLGGSVTNAGLSQPPVADYDFSEAAIVRRVADYV